MGSEQRPTEDESRSGFVDAPCATMIRWMMGRQGQGFSCLETLGVEDANGCCAEIMLRMKAACRKFAFYASIALVSLIGATILVVWALFHVAGA